MGIIYIIVQKTQVPEINFMIDTALGSIPIEVKSQDNTKSTSLNRFIEKNKVKLAYKISAKNFERYDEIKSIPLYAVFCIKNNYIQ